MTHSQRLAILLLCLPTLLPAQREDSNWLGGFEETPHVPGFANYRIRFTAGGIQVDTFDWGIPFESTTAAVSDSNGELLLFTNGCAVYDAQGQPILGGNTLNPGPLRDQVCGRYGYVVPRGATILPAPGKPDEFCILHMSATENPVRDLDLNGLSYTWVNMKANGGKGAVTKANQVMALGILEGYAVVRHGNGRDWWVVVPRWGLSRYSLFLLSPSGFKSAGFQEIGPPMGGRYNGTVAFSLQGDRLVRFNPNQGALTFGFDRCTGQLSQPKLFPPPTRLLRGGGAAFSPKGDELYVTSQSTLYAASLLAAQPKFDTVFHLFDNYTWGTTMQHLQYGPDQQLYVSTISRANYLNSIQFDAQKHASGMKFKALKLPVMTIRTLPNLPNFRLGDLHNSPCDTLGITPTAEPGPAAEFAVSVSPNPAHSEVTLRDFSPESVAQERTWRVFSSPGTAVRSAVLLPGAAEHRLNLSGLPPGMYWWELARADGSRTAGRLAVQQ